MAEHYAIGRRVETRFRTTARSAASISDALPDGTQIETKRGFLRHTVTIPASPVSADEHAGDSSLVTTGRSLAIEPKTFWGLSKRRALRAFAQEHNADMGVMKKVVSAPVVASEPQPKGKTKPTSTKYHVEMEAFGAGRAVVLFKEGEEVDRTTVDLSHIALSPIEELRSVVAQKLTTGPDGTLVFQSEKSSDATREIEPQPDRDRTLVSV